MQTLFSIANLTVFPFWLTMIFAPRWRGTTRLVRSPLIVMPPIVIYAALVLPALGAVLPIVVQPELPSVAALLGAPLGATAAWAHFLAFDLFVGRWIFLDAREHHVPAPVVSGLLIVTLLLGPLGLGAYLAVRAGLLQWLGRAFRLAAEGSAPLAWLGLFSTAVLVANLVLMVVDLRELTGAPLWLKPAKFSVSIAMAAFTLAALMRQLGPATRGMRRAAWVITAMVFIEILIIDGQAARGLTSHFNFSTPGNALAFEIMGTAITVMTIAVGYLAVIAFRRRFADRALGWGIRLGFVAMLFGSAIAFLMPRPTAGQLATLRAGQSTPVIGAHAVGVPDGGPGLPVTRWSTAGGDLRVPHFMGIHGLQVLPLVGWALSRRRRRAAERLSSETAAARLSLIAGLGYLGLVATTLVEALRGRPLLSPDAATLALASAIGLACLATAAPALWPSRQRAVPAPLSAAG